MIDLPDVTQGHVPFSRLVNPMKSCITKDFTVTETTQTKLDYSHMVTKDKLIHVLAAICDL